MKVNFNMTSVTALGTLVKCIYCVKWKTKNAENVGDIEINDKND